ncbi:MAG: hypothetical protein ACLGHX_00970 [Acidimicrobiia bacterium]
MDGTATDVGVVTVGITDGNGDTVVAAGTATTNNLDGTYTYTLANRSDVGVLYVTWTRTDTSASLTRRVEVVGNRLFTEAQARTFTITGLQTPLSSASEYPDSVLNEWHDRIVERFESKAHHSFIRRYCRIELAGNGAFRLPLYEGQPRTSVGDESGGKGRWRPRKLLSVAVGGVSVDVANVKLDHAELVRTDGTWDWATISDPFNVVIEYEYGDNPVTEDASLAGLRMLLANAIPTDIPQGVVSWSNEDGSFQRDSSGWAYPVAVYEFLKSETRKVPIW